MLANPWTCVLASHVSRSRFDVLTFHLPAASPAAQAGASRFPLCAPRFLPPARCLLPSGYCPPALRIPQSALGHPLGVPQLRLPSAPFTFHSSRFTFHVSGLPCPSAFCFVLAALRPPSSVFCPLHVSRLPCLLPSAFCLPPSAFWVSRLPRSPGIE